MRRRRQHLDKPWVVDLRDVLRYLVRLQISDNRKRFWARQVLQRSVTPLVRCSLPETMLAFVAAANAHGSRSRSAVQSSTVKNEPT